MIPYFVKSSLVKQNNIISIILDENPYFVKRSFKLIVTRGDK